MARNSLLVLTLLLACAPAKAGPFMRMLKAKQAADAARAAAAQAAVPSLPEAAVPALPAAPAAVPSVAIAAAPAIGAAPELDPTSPFYPVEARRNAALQKLADAGGREILKDAGLMLWRFDHGADGVRAAYSLTVSFFDGSRDDAELRGHVQARSPDARATLAAALGVSVDDVELRARPADYCCGSGCSTCLRSKPNASEYWTGRPPKRNSLSR